MCKDRLCEQDTEDIYIISLANPKWDQFQNFLSKGWNQVFLKQKKKWKSMTRIALLLWIYSSISLNSCISFIYDLFIIRPVIVNIFVTFVLCCWGVHEDWFFQKTEFQNPLDFFLAFTQKNLRQLEKLKNALITISKESTDSNLYRESLTILGT